MHSLAELKRRRAVRALYEHRRREVEERFRTLAKALLNGSAKVHSFANPRK